MEMQLKYMLYSVQPDRVLNCTTVLDRMCIFSDVFGTPCGLVFLVQHPTRTDDRTGPTSGVEEDDAGDGGGQPRQGRGVAAAVVGGVVGVGGQPSGKGGAAPRGEGLSSTPVFPFKVHID